MNATGAGGAFDRVTSLVSLFFLGLSLVSRRKAAFLVDFLFHSSFVLDSKLVGFLAEFSDGPIIPSPLGS